jgi:hypothetical protein
VTKKAERRVLGATRRESIDPAARSYGMDAQNPDNGARLSRNPSKNSFLSVNYLTLLDRYPSDAWGWADRALIWRIE